MCRSKLLIAFMSGIIGIILSPFIGTLVSNIYLPYAESDSQISTVFEVSSIVAFPVIVSILYLIFVRLFKNR